MSDVEEEQKLPRPEWLAKHEASMLKIAKMLEGKPISRLGSRWVSNVARKSVTPGHNTISITASRDEVPPHLDGSSMNTAAESVSRKLMQRIQSTTPSRYIGAKMVQVGDEYWQQTMTEQEYKSWLKVLGLTTRTHSEQMQANQLIMRWRRYGFTPDGVAPWTVVLERAVTPERAMHLALHGIPAGWERVITDPIVAKSIPEHLLAPHAKTMPSQGVIFETWRNVYMYDHYGWSVGSARTLLSHDVPPEYAESCFLHVRPLPDSDVIVTQLLGVTDVKQESLPARWQAKIMVPFIVDGYERGVPSETVQRRVEDAMREWVSTGVDSTPFIQKVRTK